MWSRPRLLQELAELGKSYSIRTIENLETGRRHPDAETLIDLAEVFKLTRLETKEFFSAALSPEPVVTETTESADGAIYMQQLTLLKTVRLPGFLTDYYGDIIAANKMVIRLFGISQEFVEKLAEPSKPEQDEEGLNLMRFIFDEQTFKFKSILGEKLWQEYAHNGINLFELLPFAFEQIHTLKHG